MSLEKLPTVLITGCTDGSIGHRLVLSFSRRGYHVFATARRLSAMSSLKALPNITLLELDVTSPESIRKAHTEVAAATSGRLDILYNNAGVRVAAMCIDTTYNMAVDSMSVNFAGVVEMVHVFSDLVIASKGKIVFTSSAAGRLPVPTQVTYNASKAALDAYAKTLKVEMKPLGVGVINVITGSIATAESVKPQAFDLSPLNEDSPYKSIEKELNSFFSGDAYQRSKMNLTEYSDSVVKQVTGQSSPELIWLNAGIVRWFGFFNLTWLFAIVFAKDFGLDKLKAIKA